MKIKAIVILTVLLVAAVVGVWIYAQKDITNQASLAECQKKLTLIDYQASQMSRQMDKLKNKTDEDSKKIKALEAEKAQIEQLEKGVKAKDATIASLEAQLGSRQEELSNLNQQLEDLNKNQNLTVSQKNIQIARLEAEIAAKNSALTDAGQNIDDLKTRMAREQERLTRLESEYKQIKTEKTKAESKISELDTTYKALITNLQKQIKNRNAAIQSYEEKLTLTMLDSVLFDSGKVALNKKGQRILRKVGNVLKTIRKGEIRVEGHTDNVPISSQYHSKYRSNWELSSARAANVVRFLQNETGVDPRIMEAVGCAFYKPVADNRTKRGRAKNRRVEIVIVPKKVSDSQDS